MVIVVSVAALIVVAITAHAVVPIEPVVTGKGEQWLGYANDTYIVYTQWSRQHPNNYSALAQPLAGGPLTKINPSGSRGFTGGFDPGTNRVIYEEWTRQRGSKLFFYDLDTDQRTKVAGVDAQGFFEWRPLISTTFIMFARDHFRRGDWYTSIHVYERSTGAIRRLGTWKWGPSVVFTGSVGDRYAAYTLCNRNDCWAYLYDWETNTQRRVPSLEGQGEYAPVVDETNSAIYFSQSASRKCGVRVAIWRLPLDLTGDPARIVELPRGVDTDWSSSLAVNGSSGQMDLYFERYDCERRTGDVYVARSVNLEGA